MRSSLAAFGAAVLWGATALSGTAVAQFEPDAVLLRYPDVSATEIAFRYDGDVWIVPKEGGEARRLSTPPGNESFPRFSPDGTRIAMTGGWDGGSDLYVMDLAGGQPERVTYHPGQETLCDWHPDGGSLMFFSSRNSGIRRAAKLFTIPVEGGEATALPVAYGAFGSIDPSGEWLAYTTRSREFRTWKRYKGGTAQDVWLFNLTSFEARKITDWLGTDALPMWHGREVIFLSDRGRNHKLNLWAYDIETTSTRQLTDFGEWDCKFPSIGPDDVVFENGGKLYRYEFASGNSVPVPVTIPGERRNLRATTLDVSSLAGEASAGPSGKRVAVSARGQLFNVPSEEGFTRVLTETSSVAERSPAWSPDGRWIAYLSDRSGEYEIWVRRPDGKAFTFGDDPAEMLEKRLTSGTAGWKSNLTWAPNSEWISFQSSESSLSVVEVATGAVQTLAKGRLGAPRGSWSHDGSWIAWSSEVDRGGVPAIFLHELATGSTHQVTSTQFANSEPVFDRNGDWLYWQSSRTFSPIYSDMDDTWIYTNSTRLVAAPLRADVENPWAVENDTEEMPEDESEDDGDGSEEGSGDGGGDESEDGGEHADEDGSPEGRSEEEPEGEEADEEDEDLVIELEGLESRARLIPGAGGGSLGGLTGGEGRVYYVALPRTGAQGGAPKLCYYELSSKEEHTVVEGVRSYELTADGKRILVRHQGAWAMVDAAAGQTPEPIPTDGLVSTIEPREEWAQIVMDASRLMRDYFYERGLHQVNWDGIRDRTLGALEYASSRDDLQYLISEMIGEVNVGHAYHYPPPAGLQSAGRGRQAGLLGCDWELSEDGWRIASIVGGGVYDYDARSPLAELGVDARVGDYLLEVNGASVRSDREVYAAFLGTAGKATSIVLNETPTRDGNEREVLVKPISNEGGLRYRAWVASQRARVAELSGGRVGYVHVPDTGQNGQNELVRQLQGASQAEALLVDERWNGGGQIPTRFVELLNRPLTNFWATRNGTFDWPPGALDGPKAMLINQDAGSGGDAFPFYFRQAGLGKLIGNRTWGGLVGISGGPSFVDGGRISVPSFGFFDLDGTWGIEGYGVSPDLPVLDHPTALARGGDPQLEAGVQHLLGELEGFTPLPRTAPQGPDRRGSGITTQDR